MELEDGEIVEDYLIKQLTTSTSRGTGAIWRINSRYRPLATKSGAKNAKSVFPAQRKYLEIICITLCFCFKK